MQCNLSQLSINLTLSTISGKVAKTKRRQTLDSDSIYLMGKPHVDHLSIYMSRHCKKLLSSTVIMLAKWLQFFSGFCQIAFNCFGIFFFFFFLNIHIFVA